MPVKQLTKKRTSILTGTKRGIWESLEGGMGNWKRFYCNLISNLKGSIQKHSYYIIVPPASSIVKRDIYLWEREEIRTSLGLETQSRPC